MGEIYSQPTRSPLGGDTPSTRSFDPNTSSRLAADRELEEWKSRYQSISTHALLRVVAASQDYRPAAVQAAREVLATRNQAEFGALTQAVGAELGAEGEEKQRLADEPLTPVLSEHKNGGPAWTRRLETPALRSASRIDRRRHSSFGVRSDPFVLDQHCPSLQRELE